MQKEGYDLSHFIVSTRHLIKDGAIKVISALVLVLILRRSKLQRL